MGGPVHSWPRSRNREVHHQECSRQDTGRSQGKAEKGNRGKHRHRLWAGQDLHSGNMAGGLDGKLRENQAAPIDLQNLARLSEKSHQTADRQHPAGRPDFSGLAAILQTSVGRRASRPHRGQEKAERFGTENRAKHPSDDRLGIQSRHGAEVGEQESNAGLRLAESRTQRDENPDRRPTQCFLPGGQRQRRVRALLPRPRHRTTPWGTAGAEVDGRRPRPWCAENPTGHLAAERQGSGSPPGLYL